MGETNMGRPIAMKLAFILFTLLLCVGCAATKSTQTPPPTVLITPASATVQTAATQQFTTTSTGVTWSVNGSVGGSSTTGIISSSGLYTAPSSVPTNPVVAIKAQTSSASGTATATISGSEGSTPGQIETTGGWEFVLTGSSTSLLYVETNLTNPKAGTYTDNGSGQVFGFDSTTPSFVFMTNASDSDVVTLTVDSHNQVAGTFNNSQNLHNVTFTGTAVNGTSISGTWTYGTFIAYMTTTATSVDGTYSNCQIVANGCSWTPQTITETVEGNTITEESQYGSGNYALAGNVGNWAYVPQSPSFWDATNTCNIYQCAIWLDKATGNLVVVTFSFPGELQGPPYNQVLGVLHPVQ